MEAMILEQHDELQEAELMELSEEWYDPWECEEWYDPWEWVFIPKTRIWGEVFTSQTNIMEENEKRCDETARVKIVSEVFPSLRRPWPWGEVFTSQTNIMEENEKRQMSDERGKEHGTNKISAFAYLTGVDFSPYHSRKIQRGSFGLPFQSFSYFEGTCHENERHTMQKMSDERIEERVANKISAIEEQTDVNFPDYSSKLKKGTFVLCSQFLPCAGGNDLEDSQQKQQTVNGIYQHTLRNVLHCPSVSDFIQRATDKCAEVCTNNTQDDDCSYHCMRDSHKTSLVEFCAKPKWLFDYCPEYDPIGQTMQKDIYTPCKPSNPLERFYRSSDLFFCDQGNCLQLYETGVSTGLTSLTSDANPVSGDINDTWLSQYWPIVLLLGVALIICIVLGCIFRLRGRFIANFQQWTKKGNPENGVLYEKERAVLHSAP